MIWANFIADAIPTFDISDVAGSIFIGCMAVAYPLRQV